MKCPNCGSEIPLEAGQHATVPTVDVMECPNCGASVRVGEDEQAEQTTGERTTEGGWGEERPESFAGSETIDELKDEIEQKEDE
jgi:hypothetical protein